MRIGTLVLLGAPLCAVLGNAIVAPFPRPGGNPAFDLMAYHDPAFHRAIAIWHYATPGIATLLAGSLVVSVWRVWLRPRRGSSRRGKLPPLTSVAERPVAVGRGWRAAPSDGPPLERAALLARHPRDRFLHGLLIIGAGGSGKTSACMYPFAQQLLSRQADRPERRAGALARISHEPC